ncbi:MAG: hypothetical protein RKE49_12610 [Oceanicaulis sp.]
MTGALRVTGTAAFILTVAVLARVLPPEDLGRVVLLFVAANLAAVAAQMGLGNLALSLFASHAASDAPGRARIAGARMRGLVLVSGAVAGGAVALGAAAAWPQDRILAAAAGGWTFCAAQLLINAELIRASGAVRRAAWIGGAGQTLSPACAGAGLIAAGLCWARIIPAAPHTVFIAYIIAAAAVLCISALARRGRGFGRRRDGGEAAPETGLLARARPYWLASVLPPLYTQADVFIVAIAAPPEIVGYYAAASRLAAAATLPTTILAYALAPGIAKAYAANAVDTLRRLSGSAAALSAGAALLVTAPLLLLPGAVLGAVYGAPYAAAAPALAVLAFGRLISGACGPTGAFLTAGGAGGVLAKATLWTTGFALIAALALGHQFGATGVAAGFAAALIGQNVFQLASITSRFGFLPHLALVRRPHSASRRP